MPTSRAQFRLVPGRLRTKSASARRAGKNVYGVGKTTTVRILATLLAPRCRPGPGAGPRRDDAGRAVRRRVALTGQFATVDDDLTGRENLVLLGRLAGLGRRPATGRAAELPAALR